MTSLPRADLIARLVRVGVEFPRGLLGDEAWELGNLIREQGAPPEEAVVGASRAHWEPLRAAIGAALARAEGSGLVEPGSLSELTGDSDPTNALALALSEQAGRALAAVLERADAQIAALPESAEPSKVVVVAGAIAADCIDLSSLDYEDEIETYLRAGETPAAMRDLTRETGDDELRAWAHDALDELDRRGHVTGLSRLRSVVSSAGVPVDAAEDALWIGVVTALVAEAIDIALAAEASAASEPPADPLGP
jgi:hypothetical protein